MNAKDRRPLNEMTDEELRQRGLSQEWRSGVRPSDWPYYDSSGRELDQQSLAAQAAQDRLIAGHAASIADLGEVLDVEAGLADILNRETDTKEK
ncbi:hypothetical protein [Streptomyces malaysiensis]|uniref:hypothetical protein n=1 Tax=Streptomyces malaysiensis TaxID=92644 RepID=UPI0036B8F748